MAGILLGGAVKDPAGNGIQGATIEAFDKGTTTPVRGSANTDSAGKWALDLSAGHYDVRIASGDFVRWLLYTDQIQLDTVQAVNVRVSGLFSYPAMTTTERDALSLAATDVGVAIFNTTTGQTETWNGTAWADQIQLDTVQAVNVRVSGLFSYPAMTTTERDALSLAATDVGVAIFNTTTGQTETWNGTAWV